MDYFSPGLRELGRRLARLRARWRMRLCHRRLVKAETHLGLLGWQQADFDADTQRQVDEIHGVEREQTELTNRAAARSHEIQKTQEKLQAARGAHQEERRRLEAKWRSLREPLESLERQLAEKRESEPEFGRRIPDLDRELRDTQKIYSELLNRSPQTPVVRQEIARVRERIVAIPNEKSDLRTQHLRTVSAIRSLEEQIERSAPTVKEIEVELQRLDAEWALHERELTARIESASVEKRNLDAQFESLERAKVNPYQRIGRVLADSNLAPVNQPHALEAVKALRFEIADLHHSVLESDARTAAEDQRLLKLSLLLWAAGAGLLLLLCFAVVR